MATEMVTGVVWLGGEGKETRSFLKDGGSGDKQEIVSYIYQNRMWILADFQSSKTSVIV